MVPSAIAWMRPWPAAPIVAAMADELVDRCEGARGQPCPSASMWPRNRLLEKPAAPASKASRDEPGHLGDLVAGGVLVVVARSPIT